MTKHKKQRLMAFWKYDGFPKMVLSSEVDEFAPKSKVKVKNYGGMTVTPVAVVLFEEGEAMAEQLDSICNEYNEQLNELKNQTRAKLRDSLPFLKELPYCLDTTH